MATVAYGAYAFNYATLALAKKDELRVYNLQNKVLRYSKLPGTQPVPILTRASKERRRPPRRRSAPAARREEEEEEEEEKEEEEEEEAEEAEEEEGGPPPSGRGRGRREY